MKKTFWRFLSNLSVVVVPVGLIFAVVFAVVWIGSVFGPGALLLSLIVFFILALATVATALGANGWSDFKND